MVVHVLFAIVLECAAVGAAPESEGPSAAQRALIEAVDGMQSELVAINQDIWEYAELGLVEFRSTARLIGALRAEGFRVDEGIADMPTAFVAQWGSGQPVIGILAEYDALPDLSQAVDSERRAVAGRTTGHGCGHCALGTAAVGAAIAAKRVCQEHGLSGTIRLYGTPAEETVIGKVYMTLAGTFADLDACLHWHPGTRNRIQYQSSKALISAKFTFSGLAAHASASPTKGRSALDAVELMNIGANYMREHIEETSRIHYVITAGGGAPNVVPASAQVWYFIRANEHSTAQDQYAWICDIAQAAAKMSRTRVAIQVDTDCHEIIPNLPLSQMIERNFRLVGPPVFAEAEVQLARRLQEPLRADFGLDEKKALEDAIESLPEEPYPAEGGSTDVGDVSWHVPTGGLSTVCFPAGSPGHSWQNVASIGSSIGHKGLIVAAKVLGLSTLDLLRDPQLRARAKDDFQGRMKDRPYTTVIPKGQKPPKAIR